MSRRTLRAAVAALGAAAALFGLLGVRAEPPESWSEEERVILAMFEREVPLARTAFPGEGVRVCLLVDTGGAARDPSPKVLEAVVPRDAVRRGAECEARGDGAVEIRGEAPAVILTVGPIEWIADDEAWVKVARFRDRQRLSTATHRVVRDHGRWVALGPILKQSPA